MIRSPFDILDFLFSMKQMPLLFSSQTIPNQMKDQDENQQRPSPMLR
jgi:hypothetical protein